LPWRQCCRGCAMYPAEMVAALGNRADGRPSGCRYGGGLRLRGLSLPAAALLYWTFSATVDDGTLDKMASLTVPTRLRELWEESPSPPPGNPGCGAAAAGCCGPGYGSMTSILGGVFLWARQRLAVGDAGWRPVDAWTQFYVAWALYLAARRGGRPAAAVSAAEPGGGQPGAGSAAGGTGGRARGRQASALCCVRCARYPGSLSIARSVPGVDQAILAALAVGGVA
jgi:hypothetical protein